MRLFLKHLFRSILKKPLQPFVLVLTLTLSIAVSIFSFVTREALEEEIAQKQVMQYGNAQISITLNGTSQSRFMFEKDVEKVLGDRAKTAGTFELPLVYGEEKQTVFGVATDFQSVENVFQFRFLNYGTLTPSLVQNAAFISKDFALKNHLEIGDTFTVTAFGMEKEYQVIGVSLHRFLGGYDMMVDITSVVRQLAKDSLLLSSLGDAFKPCSSIFITPNATTTANECFELLKENEKFSDKTISFVADAVKASSFVEDLVKVLDVSVLLTSLLAAAVTFCCFYILASERAWENYAFTLSGARASKLHLLQYLEITVYWFVSSILGVMLVPLFVQWLFPFVNFQYASGVIRIYNVIKGIGFFLAVSYATVTLFIVTQNKKGKKSPKKQMGKMGVFTLLGITMSLMTAIFFVPSAWKFPLYLCALVAVIFTLFVGAPLLFKFLARKWNTQADKKFFKTYRMKNTAFAYARKNLYTVRILHNISRLVTVLVCILTTVAFATFGAFGNVQANEEFFTADYAVLNATESCTQKVQSCETVEACYKVFFVGGSKGNYVSVDNLSAISCGESIAQLPQGNDAVLTYGEAQRMGLKVMDTFQTVIGDQEITLQVRKIVKSSIAFILFNAENFEIPYNYLMVKGDPNVAKGTVLGELTEKTALELAVIAQMDSIFASKLEIVHICVKLGLMLLCMLVFFSAVGIADNLYESYRARKTEFSLYQNSGMSKREVRKMKAWEITLSFGFAILLGGLAFIPLACITNGAFYAFALEIWQSFIYYIV